MIGEQERAFTTDNTFAHVPNLADIFYEKFGGRSLIVSISGNVQLAKGASIRPYINQVPNKIIVTFDEMVS